MEKVDVTVLISVRNEGEYIGETIESLLNQTYKNFELWVIDDGSTDNTWKVIKSFNDKRLRSWRFNVNLGMTKIINWAIPKIKTKYVARMDSHNVAKSDRLQKQVNYMTTHPMTMAIGSNYSRIDEDGKVLLVTNFPTEYRSIKLKLMEKNLFKHASMFIRREVYDLAGFYDPYFRIAQDYDFILRVAAKYPVGNLSDVLITETYRTANLSQRFRVRSAWEALVVQVKGLTKYSYPAWQSIYLLRGVGFLGKSIIYKFISK